MIALQKNWPSKSFDAYDGYSAAGDAIAAADGVEFAIPSDCDRLGCELYFTAVSRAITSLARVTNVVTVTTTANHGLEVGQSVTIAGTDEAAFHGTFTVASVPNPDEFTYAQTDSDDTALGGTATVSAPVTVQVDIQTKVDVNGTYETKDSLVGASSIVLSDIASQFVKARLVAQSGSAGLNLVLFARRAGA